MYSLLYLVCMDAGLLCTRGAPGRAWDTPEALRTRGSLLWIPWSDKRVPCPSPIQGSRVGQQLTVPGPATQHTWKFGVALLRYWWMCREGRRVVNIMLGTQAPARTHTHSRTLSHLHLHPLAVTASGVMSPMYVEVPLSPSSRLSCVPVLPQPSAVSGSSNVNLTKTPSALPSLFPPKPWPWSPASPLGPPWAGLASSPHCRCWVIPPHPSHRQNRAPGAVQIWEAIADPGGQKQTLQKGSSLLLELV